MPNFLHRKVLSLLLIAVAVWLGRGLWVAYGDRSGVQEQLADIQDKVEKARQDNQQLASSSAYFKSDSYLEKQARLKLNYKLPDEQVTFIYPDKSDHVASVSVPTSGGWKSWFYKIFKRD